MENKFTNSLFTTTHRELISQSLSHWRFFSRIFLQNMAELLMLYAFLLKIIRYILYQLDHLVTMIRFDVKEEK